MSDTVEPNRDRVESQRDLVPVAPQVVNAAPFGRGGGPADEDLHDLQAATPMGITLAWQTFCGWWHICMPLGILLAAGLAAAVWYTFEPVYEAEAWLRIEATTPSIFFVSETGGVAATAARFERTQVELMRSPVVLEKVLEEAAIAKMPEILEADTPIDVIREGLDIASTNESDLFYVRFQSPRAEDAELVVNTVVKHYIQVQDDETVERNRRIVQLLESEVTKRSGELDQLRANVESLAAESGVDPALAQMNQGPLASTTALAELEKQLTTSQAEREVLLATATAYEEAMANPPEISAEYVDDMLEQAVQQSLEFQQLEQRLAAKRMLLADTIPVSPQGAEDPAAVKIQKEIDGIESRIEELRSELKVRMAPSLKKRLANAQRDELAKDSARIQVDIKAHEALEKYLIGKIDEQRGTLENSPEEPNSSSAQLAKLQYARSDLARAEQVYQQLLERVDILRTESRAPSRVTTLSPAKTPLAPKEAIPWRGMSTASAIGLLLPFLLAFLWEFRVQRVTAGKQISRITMLPLLAEVPVLPSRAATATARSNGRFEIQRARFQDSVHYLCRSLLLSANARDLQVLAVTSAISGEGKTTLASQLARSFALYSNERVLLVDADMRDPSIHELFDAPPGPGLAELLVSENGVATAAEASILRGPLDLVGVLPAGNLDRHPHAVLRAGKLEKLLKELRKSYRYIILDTPPVASVGEALSICKAADATLLAARQDWSRKSQVQLAYERVLAVGAKPIGVVLSGVSHLRYASTYGHYGTPPQK